jgi:hypothetical protein
VAINANRPVKYRKYTGTHEGTHDLIHRRDARTTKMLGVLSDATVQAFLKHWPEYAKKSAQELREEVVATAVGLIAVGERPVFLSDFQYGRIKQLYEDILANPPTPPTGQAADGEMAHSLGNFIVGEMARDAKDSAVGRSLVLGLDQAASKTASLVGQIANENHAATKALTREDKKWLQARDAKGYSNLQKLLEATPGTPVTSPNARITEFVRVYNKGKEITGKEAERVKLPLLAGGLFKMAKTGRFLRDFSDDAHEAMHYGSGPMFEAMVKAIVRDNPGLKAPAVKDMLLAAKSPDPIRHHGSLEKLREIKNLPSFVQLKGGQWVPVLNVNPVGMVPSAVRSMGRRIYFFEQFGKDTRVARMRARHVAHEGSEEAFNNIISVYYNRPFRRVWGNPRNLWRRLLRVADDIVAAGQTSLSAIPNLPQTLVQVPRYVGVANYLRAVAQTMRHPLATSADAATVGAINRSLLDFTFHEGQLIEDAGRIATGLFTRVNMSHWVAHWNNIVASAAFKFRAEQWKKHGIPSGDTRLAQELRLTAKEIAETNAGSMSTQTYQKIIQNGVKVTQYVTEDSHRQSEFQNIPLLSSVFAYNNYLIGTTKSSFRMAGDLVEAIRSGQRDKIIGSTRRMLIVLAGLLGAGLLGMMLRRAAYRKELVKPDETNLQLVAQALQEVQVLGPVQRMYDAATYSNNAEQALVRLSPKFKIICDSLQTAWMMLKENDNPKPSDPTTADRADRFGKRNIPAYRAIRGVMGDEDQKPQRLKHQ